MGNIKLALRGIWSHKLRSILTMLGIIIGIASIIAIVATINGTSRQIKQNLIGDGSNTVDVALYEDNYQMDFSVQEAPDGVRLLKESLIEKIEALEEVESASAYHMRSTYNNLYYLNNSLSGGTVIGADDKYLSVNGYEIASGRNFSENDYATNKKVAIIDDKTAENIFESEEPVGKVIEIENEPFTVIGVAEKRSDFMPEINTISDYYTYVSDYSSGIVVIPDTVWPVIYRFDEPQFVSLKAVDTDSMTEAGKKAADILNDEYSLDGKTVYKGSSVMEQAKELEAVSRSTNNQLIWIAAISLLVGGIGVVNIMLVSVTERTSEIGLKKALGAVKSKILIQFLAEASVLTALGGILGVGAGIVLAYIIGKVSSVPIAISAWSVILAVGVSVVIGLVFGLLPAVKASRMNPIVALQRE